MARNRTVERDPVFQLNVLLWSLIDTHPYGGLFPVLRERGYHLNRIALDMRLGFDKRERLTAEFGNADAGNVDVLAGHADVDGWLAFECKANSFGPESSTSVQAKKLLLGCHDLETPTSHVGLRHRAATLVYVVPDGAQTAMTASLDALTIELNAKGWRTAPTASAGILVDETGIWLVGHDPARWPVQAAAAIAPKALVRAPDPDGNDLRPLYIIPWDPTVEYQDPAERNFCLGVFHRRAGRDAALVVSRSTDAMTRIPLDALLDSTTSGAAGRWNPKDRRNAGLNLRDFIRGTLSEAGFETSYDGNDRIIEVLLPNEADRARASDALLSAAPPPAVSSVTEYAEQPELPLATE